ncbi:hypothetical protein DNK34_20685 [Pseudomonas dryadis]|uniref:Uncharacterized protein n=1 Tax=Phytopseudomonas dryadis TaxID=2487520 RepID=A0A4Q9QY09_9GAMM|nr:hypothetical protein DNK44_18165 [Pseudomonas dryadis]TBV01677.1 hypothetical protein DNK34_20685 [Pseudomonas dryadis]TBV14162.1 hypothetical protein DNK41_20450 [Pseudomonas sp. FRB 230]
MVFPCQVLQRRMARFPAQPVGPGPFCRDTAFLAGSFGQPNFAARALPRGKTGSGAVVLKRQQTLGPGAFHQRLRMLNKQRGRSSRYPPR